MKTLTTNEALKTLLSSGDDVRIYDEDGMPSNIEIDLYREDGLSWVIGRGVEHLNFKQRRGGRVFAGSAYAVDSNGRRTGLSLVATMAPATVVDVLREKLIPAFRAVENEINRCTISSTRTA